MACLNYDLVFQLPEFKKLKEDYAEKHLSDKTLADALMYYRMYSERDADWFPQTPAERGALTRFINNDFVKYKAFSNRLEMTEPEMNKIYTKVNSYFPGRILNERLDYMSHRIAERILDIHRRNPNYPLTRLIKNFGRVMNEGKLSGYQGLIKEFFDKYVVPYLNTDGAYNKMLADRKEEGKASFSEEELAELKNKAEGVSTRMQQMYDMRGELAALVAPRISELIGLKITVRGLKLNVDIPTGEGAESKDVEVVTADEDGDETGEQTDVQGDDSQQEDSTEDDDKDLKGDRYIDMRTVTLVNRLAPKVREFLSTITLKTPDGMIDRGELDEPLYANVRSFATILQKVGASTTSETFLEDIKEAALHYSQLNFLLEALEKQPEYTAMLYSAFANSSYSYGYMKLGKKKQYEVHDANSKAQNRAMMQQASINMHGHILDEDYSIYDTSGRVKSVELINKFISELEEIQKRFNDFRPYIRMMSDYKRFYDYFRIEQYRERDIEDAKNRGVDLTITRSKSPIDILNYYIETHQDDLKKLTKMLRGCGFDVSLTDVIQTARTRLTYKSLKIITGYNTSPEILVGKMYKYNGENRLSYIIGGVLHIYGTATNEKYFLDRNVDRLYNLSDGFLRVNDSMALSKVQEKEARVNVNNKKLSTYNNRNLIHIIADKLNNVKQLPEEEYRKELYDTFLCLEGMSLGSIEGLSFEEWRKQMISKAELNDPTGSMKFSREKRGRELWYTDDIYGSNDPYDVNIKKGIKPVGLLRAAFRNGGSSNKDVGGKAAPLVNIMTVSEYNHVEYANMSDQQRKLAHLLMWFGGEEFGCYVEFPIQSDYDSAYDFIGTACGSYKNAVAGLVDEVLIELETMEAVKKRREAAKTNPNIDNYGVYDENSMRFNIFPAFNTNGFLDGYNALKDNAFEVREFVEKQVQTELDKVIAQDIEAYEKAGVFKNELLQNQRVFNKGAIVHISLYSKTGKFKDIEETKNEEFPDGVGKLVFKDFCASVFYTRQQAIKIFCGGMAQYKSLTDFEKRNMMQHAPHSSLYLQAHFKYKNGQRIRNNGNEKQLCLYVNDVITPTAFFEDIKQVLNEALTRKYISAEQYKTMLASYTKINATDGQGFRTFDSYRSLMIRMGSLYWNEKQERAYWAIKRGEITPDVMDVFVNNFKPVFAGQEIRPAQIEGEKPVRINVLHKYSETVLLPLVLLDICSKVQAPALRGFAAAVEQIEKETGKKIDLILPTSCVKTGCFGVIDQNVGSDYKVTKADAYRDNIVSMVKEHPEVIHELDWEYFGEAASIHSDVEDTKIAPAVQAETCVWSNIENGDTVVFNGKEIETSKLRDMFYSIKSANVIETFSKLRDFFSDPIELQRALQEELADKPYNSRELQYALQCLNKNGYSVPLFSPNVEHQVQNLFISIIKKRMLKPKSAGANMLQQTSIGFDVATEEDNGIYEDEYGIRSRFVYQKDDKSIKDSDKLRAIYETDKHGNRVLKYYEVYLPLTSKFIRKFTENGEITPERLDYLVKKGIIPESLLYFYAYRTPSDAKHSVIPCKIKGFTANINGVSIMLPREAMVKTGHDYDGDKLRCHFKEFYVTDKDENEVDISDDELVRAILGQVDIPAEEQLKLVEYKYDYDKEPLDNNIKARTNAQIDMIISQLQSPASSAESAIPGGCSELTLETYALNIILNCSDANIREQVRNEIKIIKYNELAGKKGYLTDAEMETYSRFYATVDARLKSFQLGNFYKTLKEMGLGPVTKLFEMIQGQETPYSVSHADKAFQNIVVGKQMISVYAAQAGASLRLQRANLVYTTHNIVKKEGGKVKSVKSGNPLVIFEHTYGKLFNVRDHNGHLASLAYAQLINAAVDNGKNPILGMLNQNKKFSDITAFMLAAGSTTEEISTILLQPVVRELYNRMSQVGTGSMLDTIDEMLNEFKEKNPSFVASKKYNNTLTELLEYSNVSLKIISKLTPETAVDYLARNFDIDNIGEDDTFIIDQLAVLQLLAYLNKPAAQLKAAMQFVRPDSSSGPYGSTIASMVNKEASLDNFLEKWKDESNTVYGNYIEGFENTIGTEDVETFWDNNYLYERLVSDSKSLSDLHTLSTLMLRNAQDFFRIFFPQVNPSWKKEALFIAEKYDSLVKKDKLLENIFNEMILWKLLSNKKFVKGNLQSEQYNTLVGVPKAYLEVLDRIRKVKKQKEEGKEVTDKAAEALIGNDFLRNLRCNKPYEDSYYRLQYALQGAMAEGQVDLIKNGWSQLVESEDKQIRDLGIGLFKYNIYSAGFSYNMYEFAHFAPYTVLVKTPGYIDALNDMMKSSWNDDVDRLNFENYYYLNHWGDTGLVAKLDAKTVGYSTEQLENAEQIEILNLKALPKKVRETIEGSDYLVLQGPAKKSYQLDNQYLFEVTKSGDTYILVKRTKLGVRNQKGQVTLFYNPQVYYADAKRIIDANAYAWGALSFGKKPNKTTVTNEQMSDEEREAIVNSLGAASPDEARMKATAASMAGVTRVVGRVNTSVETDKKNTETSVEQSAEKDSTSKVNPSVTTQPKSKSVISAEVNSEDAPVNPVTSIDPNDTLFKASANALFGKNLLHIVNEKEDGYVEEQVVPATPDNVRLARKQRVYVRLNEKLRALLEAKGISVGALYNMDERLRISGITIFDRPTVIAEGLLEMIRIAQGYIGEMALPEEFGHLALEMLGHEHPLVERLLAELGRNDKALRDAFDGMYDEYVKTYNEDKDRLILEAAGKLVAKKLLREEEIQESAVKRLLYRIVDAIKALLRKFSISEVQNAIFDANEIASEVARGILGGRLVDDMSIENITQTDPLFKKVTVDLTTKNDITSKLLKTETKRLDILKKRVGYLDKQGGTDEKKDPEKYAVVRATEGQIEKLRKSILTHKTEEAIYTYMSNSIEFLKESERSLDDAVNSGRPLNSVCRKLNIMRDTICSFSQSLDDIQSAMEGGEIEKNDNIEASIEKLTYILNKLNRKYNSLARHYFELMLSSVYGDDGVTVTIGKNKGKHLSIHELATQSEGDISFMSRMFNAVADCNDYVLKAVDDIVRNAKFRSRIKATQIKKDIEVAVADLLRETGSRDSSFMFERKDGKRTGKYISKTVAEKTLSPAQKKFYDRMMKIKKEADSYLPISLVSEDNLKIVMVRKLTMERYKSAEGAKGKALVAWESLKNGIMDMSDDFDPETKTVVKDMQGNKVDMLTVKFTNKGKNESYDDMTEDVATSMMAYAGMACEYAELNNVAATIENAKYMAAERDVQQKAGQRKEQEKIETDLYNFTKPFTLKAARSQAQQALEDFISMHLYGHIAADEGTFGNSRISKRKTVDLINTVVSLSQMALNPAQRIANISTGIANVYIQSAGKGVFNSKDLKWACGQYRKQMPKRLSETGKTDVENKMSLFNEFFDVLQVNGRYKDKYAKGRMSRIFNTHLLYAGLSAGEDFLASVTALCVARNFKMKDSSGKIINLWDAFEVKYTDEVNKAGAYLALKAGVKKADGSEFTDNDRFELSKSIASLNFEMQGIYNLDDKSAIQQYTFGALIIMYRKWIAPALKRRYGPTQYSALTKSYQEGYYTTLWNLFKESFSDAKDEVSDEESKAFFGRIISTTKAMVSSYKLNRANMTEYEKSNIRKAWRELAIVAGLFLSTYLLLRLPPDDDKDDDALLTWVESFGLSQLLRLRSELGAMAPTPLLVWEGLRILKSPFAAIGPIQSTLNIFQLMLPHNWFIEIKSGRYKGHVKAYKYFREFPIISMFKRIDNFIDPSYTLNYYANESATTF